MDPALRAAATGMAAQQTRVEVIANNLANVNTPGFKRSRAQFEDLLYQTVQGSQAILKNLLHDRRRKPVWHFSRLHHEVPGFRRTGIFSRDSNLFLLPGY